MKLFKVVLVLRTRVCRQCARLGPQWVSRFPGPDGYKRDGKYKVQFYSTFIKPPQFNQGALQDSILFLILTTDRSRRRGPGCPD